MKRLCIILTMLFTMSTVVQAEHLENVKIPKDTKVDWMELQSGEWIRGEFKGLFSGKIEFESKEFDLVKFDVDDVKQIITLGNSTINLNREMPKLGNIDKVLRKDLFDTKNNEVTGNLKFSDGKFQMRLSDGTTREIPSKSITSIFGGEDKESNYWSISMFLGIDVLSGNTEQITATGKSSIERRTALTRLRIDSLSTYTQVDINTTTADNSRYTGSFDLYQTNHFFWRLGSLEYIRDPFKNIAAKYTYSLGVGYDILNSDTIDWSVSAGPGYQETHYNSVDVNGSATVSTSLFYFDTRYSQELTDDIDFLVNYNMYLVNKKSGRYIHHTEISLQTELVKNFTLDLSLFWDRVSSPVKDDAGVEPKKDDFKTMFAVGYTY